MKPLNLEAFLNSHKLPASYGDLIQQQFLPVAATIAKQRQVAARPLLVGINGCQGSGKTTLADALVMLLQEVHNLRAQAVSIDDFYLTKAEREHLGSSVHPLLRTRGVPGTHATELARQTLAALTAPAASTVAVPQFDKASDDRLPEEQWPQVESPLDVVILEGWCVGATPQSPAQLLDPVNDLEKYEDPDGVWRRYVNDTLEADYQALFHLMDVWVMLKAPSFDTVFRWRLEQEDKLRAVKQSSGADTSGLMSAKQVERFIGHYQRITEHTLKTMPNRVHFLFKLDQQRNITDQLSPRKLELDIASKKG